MSHLILLLVAMGLVACAKNNGSSSPPPPAVITPPGPNINGCANCFPGGAMMISNAQAASGYNTLEMAVDIYGNSSGGANFADPKVMLFYSGPVYVEAYMQITSNNYCNAPQGEYVVSTVQAGNSNLGAMNNMVLQATGPAQMILRVNSAVIYNGDLQGVSRDSQGNRLGINMNIESVNGQSCGIFIQLY